MHRSATDRPQRRGSVSLRPSIQALRYFCAVMENGSFSAAARALHMSQPPLSQAIATLEHRWDVQLFTRTSRDVRPLPAADALYPEVLDILRRVDALPARARAARADHVRTPVRVGAVTSAFTRLVSAILIRATDLDLTVTDLPSAGIVEEITAGRLDAGLVRETPAEGVECVTLLEEELRACVPADHPLASRSTCTLADLAAEPLVIFDRTRATLSYDAIMTGFRLAGVRISPVAQVGSETAAIALVRGGLGVTVVPGIAAHSTLPDVRFLTVEDAHITYPLQLVVAAGDPRGLAAPLTSLIRDAIAGIDHAT